MRGSRCRRSTAALVPLLLVLVPLAACGGSDGDAEASVRLQPATTPGPDPFSASVVVGPAAGYQAQTAAIAASTTTTSLPADRAAGTAVATGTAPRLYGGTGDARVCDPAQLVDFLDSHGDKAAAWAKVLGVASNEIESYVAGLTPVLLTTDTRVTNHGYRAGEPTSFQAVLQAGTAVMVDARGVPRVKCNCGNPLTPPEPLVVADATVEGARWPGYDPAGVITVRPGARVDRFTLVNVETGADYTVPVGSSRGVDLRTVDWRNRSYGTIGNGDCPEAALRDGEVANQFMGVRLAQVAYGDLTGDGAEEALVTLECYPVGGNAYPMVVSFVFTSGPGGPTRLGDVIVGAQPTIVGGAVRTADPVWAPADPRCCPSRTDQKTWRLVDGRWVSSSAAPTAPTTNSPPPSSPPPSAPPVTSAGGATGPCSVGAFQAAVTAADGPQRRVVEVVGCDGTWAALGLTLEGGEGDQTSGFMHWNGRVWAPADCRLYQNGSDPFTPRPGTVPVPIFQAGCASN